VEYLLTLGKQFFNFANALPGTSEWKKIFSHSSTADFSLNGRQ